MRSSFRSLQLDFNSNLTTNNVGALQFVLLQVRVHLKKQENQKEHFRFRCDRRWIFFPRFLVCSGCFLTAYQRHQTHLSLGTWRHEIFRIGTGFIFRLPKAVQKKKRDWRFICSSNKQWAELLIDHSSFKVRAEQSWGCCRVRTNKDTLPRALGNISVIGNILCSWKILPPSNILQPKIP